MKRRCFRSTVSVASLLLVGSAVFTLQAQCTYVDPWGGGANLAGYQEWCDCVGGCFYWDAGNNPACRPNCKSAGGTSSSSSSPGTVSFNGPSQGLPFFSEHRSTAFEEWGAEYLRRLKAKMDMNGVSGDDFLVTGDSSFDFTYNLLSKSFNPAVPGGRAGAEPPLNIGKPVPLMGNSPMTTEEMQRKKLIEQFGPNYAEQASMFRLVDAGGSMKESSGGETFEDKAMTFLLDKLPKTQLQSRYAEWMENLSEEVMKQLEAAPEAIVFGQNVSSGPDVAVINATVTSVKEYLISAATDAVNSAVTKKIESFGGWAAEEALGPRAKSDYEKMLKWAKSGIGYWKDAKQIKEILASFGK